MELTIEQLMQGKATKIKNKEYLSTEAYVTPFLDRMSKLTDNFIINAKPADQISLTNNGDINFEDAIYNRVWIQGVLPEEYCFDNHKQSISLLYALDTRKPVVKIFRNALNMACLNMCVWSPDFIDVKELEPESAIDFRPLNRLMDLTDNTKVILDKLHNTEVKYDPRDIDESLGNRIKRAMNYSCTNISGKIKVSASLILDAYKLLYYDEQSPYYIAPGTSTTMFNIYNAHTQIISDDKRDIVNKFEKCGIISKILGISDFE